MEKSPKYEYITWKSPEDMHNSARQWLSTLKFYEVEHQFFEGMLREYTMPIIDSKLFSTVKALIDRLLKLKNYQRSLSLELREHIQGLDILLDGKDQPDEEKKFKKEHREILKRLLGFSEEYQELKKEIFKTVSTALKNKNKRDC